MFLRALRYLYQRQLNVALYRTDSASGWSGKHKPIRPEKMVDVGHYYWLQLTEHQKVYSVLQESAPSCWILHVLYEDTQLIDMFLNNIFCCPNFFSLNIYNIYKVQIFGDNVGSLWENLTTIYFSLETPFFSPEIC